MVRYRYRTGSLVHRYGKVCNIINAFKTEHLRSELIDCPGSSPYVNKTSQSVDNHVNQDQHHQTVPRAETSISDSLPRHQLTLNLDIPGLSLKSGAFNDPKEELCQSNCQLEERVRQLAVGSPLSPGSPTDLGSRQQHDLTRGISPVSDVTGQEEEGSVDPLSLVATELKVEPHSFDSGADFPGEPSPDSGGGQDEPPSFSFDSGEISGHLFVTDPLPNDPENGILKQCDSDTTGGERSDPLPTSSDIVEDKTRSFISESKTVESILPSSPTENKPAPVSAETKTFCEPDEDQSENPAPPPTTTEDDWPTNFTADFGSLEGAEPAELDDWGKLSEQVPVIAGHAGDSGSDDEFGDFDDVPSFDPPVSSEMATVEQKFEVNLSLSAL